MYDNSLQQGHKDDTKKVEIHLIAPEFITTTAAVLTFGAKKYAPYNWAKGIVYSRCFSAMMRHMWAWWKGETLDPETGITHLGHAACCLMFLIAYEERGMTEFDDRFKRTIPMTSSHFIPAIKATRPTTEPVAEAYLINQAEMAEDMKREADNEFVPVDPRVDNIDPFQGQKS